MPKKQGQIKITMRQILVTSALPYANGSIHIGHLVEYIQTDIWVRYLRMQNHEVYYIGADDTHGTPIMLRAQKEGITPDQLIANVWQEHKQDFDDFLISFDNYSSTHSIENQELVNLVYKNLQNSGLIITKDIEQAYDEVEKMFLPDRFVKGECPKCGAKDQYGDNCEVCGATYAPTDLKNSYSVVSGTKPINKISTHYFFQLSNPKAQQFLQQWVQNLSQNEAINKLQEWLKNDALTDWDISRDSPYFGFKIPDTENKYFYVWLDAPLGYYASFKQLCTQKNIDFNEWIKPDTTTEQYHFIGKDILYFHTLFWPAMLNFSGFRVPSNVFAHGFLTVDNQKMSKSRGTFITARTYLKHLNPEYLRYYFACKLNSSLEDIDLNLEDFTNRVNSDIIGKFINIASRTSKFLSKFDNMIDNSLFNHTLREKILRNKNSIIDLYKEREYNKAVRQIMHLIDEINLHIDEYKPWAVVKQIEASNKMGNLELELQKNLQQFCSLILECFRIVTIYLQPITPNLASKIYIFLNINESALYWHDIEKKSLQGKINNYEHLINRVSIEQVQSILSSL